MFSGRVNWACGHPRFLPRPLWDIMGERIVGPEFAMSLLQELKRRNVFRAAAAYVAVAWLLIQVAAKRSVTQGVSERSSCIWG